MALKGQSLGRSRVERSKVDCNSTCRRENLESGGVLKEAAKKKGPVE